jgi:hypothetical protein
MAKNYSCKLDGVVVMKEIFSVLVEFFEAIQMKKAHWYRVFDPDGNDVNCNLIKATFPCLSLLMSMSKSYMRQLYLYLGLAKQKKTTYGYMLYPCHDGWDNFIEKEKKLNMETT